MEFKEVDANTLVPKKYKMKWEDYEYIGTFHQFTGIYADFKDVYLKNTYLPVLYLRKDICTFYQPILGKAQQSMEIRAVNLILQHILQDPYFHW